MIEIGIREGHNGDDAFVFTTWLKSYKHGSDFAKRIRNGVFFPWHHKVVAGILGRPGTTLLIAHVHDDPDVVLGYLCVEAGEIAVVHYVFVKPNWRQLGIARQLLNHAGVTDEGYFTHWTYIFDSVRERFPKFTYDPYRI
jgi:ribosomal protein S18 acetylase RimI-like enzyme